MARAVERSEEAHNRLTVIGDLMLEAFDAHPDRVADRDRVVVLLSDGERGAVAMTGYENDEDALPFLVDHLDAILQTLGKRVEVVDA
jgi:hypothetical protein